MSGKGEAVPGPLDYLPGATVLAKTAALIIGILFLLTIALAILEQLYRFFCWIVSVFTTTDNAEAYYDFNQRKIKYRKKQPPKEVRRQFYIPESTLSYGLPSNIKVEKLSEDEYRSQRYRSKLVVIAVDATPERGAGIFYDKQRNFATYYSINWEHLLNFHGMESDKFESFNALLAFYMFRSILKSLEKDSFLFKVDNTVILDGYRKEKNAKYRAIYEKFVWNLSGTNIPLITLQHTTKGFDHFVKVADKLSRNNVSGAEELISNKLECRIDKLEDSYVKKTLVDIVNQLKEMSISQFDGAYTFIK